MTARKGLFFVFISALLFSMGGLLVKVIPWNSLSINSFRSLISVLMLLAFARLTKQKLKLTPGVFAGGCAVCAATVLYAMANKLTTAANTILLQFSAPAFVILFMWLVFRERPRKLDVVACLAVFCGIMCFFLDSLGSGNLLGDGLALLSGVAYSWVFLLNKIPGGDPLSSTTLGHAMGALIGLPWLLQETQFDASTLTAAIVLGVFQLGLAYVFLSTGIRYAPPISASLVSGIEPILNPVLVAIVLGEMLTPLSLLGGALVFLSVMIYNILCIRLENRAAEDKTQTTE